MSLLDKLQKLSIRDIIPPKSWRDIRKAGYRTGRAALREYAPWVKQLDGLADNELTFEEIAWLVKKLEALRSKLPPQHAEELENLLARFLLGAN